MQDRLWQLEVLSRGGALREDIGAEATRSGVRATFQDGWHVLSVSEQLLSK